MASSANLKEFRLQLVNKRTQLPVNDDSGEYQVYTQGSPVRATIYNSVGTALTQAVANDDFVGRTMTDGVITFFTTQGITSVDISVLTAGGRAYWLKQITSSQQRVDVDPEKHEYTLIAGINDVASSTNMRKLGFTARKGMIVNDVYLKVTSSFRGAATGNNLFNIGITGDLDAFGKNLNLTATGYKQILVHSSTGKIFATQFAGAELANWDTSSGQTVMGWFTRKKYFTPADKQLAFARAVALTGSQTGTAAASGKAYVFYQYQLDPTANSNL